MRDRRADTRLSPDARGRDDLFHSPRRDRLECGSPLSGPGRHSHERNRTSAGASATASVLRPFLPPIAGADFVASPLQRASETMRIVRATLGLEPDDFRIDDRLKEAHYGYWQGDACSRAARKSTPTGVAGTPPIPTAGARGAAKAIEDLDDSRRRPGLRAYRRDTVVVSHGGVSRVAARAHSRH